MLTQGTTKPRYNINLYLQLLKEELDTLWVDERVNSWDTVVEDYFPMRAASITTMHDYLSYIYIAGQVCHGSNECQVHGSDDI
jgi:hypothetical protein